MGTEAALIFGAMRQPDWTYLDSLRPEKPVVICADGGLACAREAGFIPSIYVGDCDSGGEPIKDGESYLLPVHKDETDMEAAYRCAKEKKHSELYFTACTGGRQDHQIAVLQLLEKAYDEGFRAAMLDPCNRITCIGAGELHYFTNGYRYFSLLPIDEQLSGVTIRHAEYPLQNAAVRRGSSLCVSNEAPSGYVEIVIQKGKAWFVLSK